MQAPIVHDAKTLRDALLTARRATDHDGAGAVATAQLIVMRAAIDAAVARVPCTATESAAWLAERMGAAQRVVGGGR